MSFKPIDVQTSLPRTAEMSQLAGHQQFRPQAEQAMLAQQSVKLTQQQGQQLIRKESPTKGEINDRDGQGSGQHRRQGNKRQGHAAPEQENKPAHPFKGKHIDYIW